MTENIAIITAHDGKNISTSTWELYAFAKKLKVHTTADICFFLVGEDTRKLAEEINSRTGCPAIAADVPNTGNYHGEIYKKTLAHLLAEHSNDYILAPHSISGMDYAPALSIILNGSCITGVEDIKAEGDVLYFVRAMFNGKLQADMQSQGVSNSSPLILTLQPGAFKPLQPNKKLSPKIIHGRFDFSEDRMRYQGKLPSPSQGSNLAKAEVIVSGGRGIEEQENYQFIEMLATIFPRAATGASRPICDYGWAPYKKQVGATGTIVSPKLYIACGISGSTQHLQGIRDSRFIVVINKDPTAPIFQVADVCIVEDLIKFIPILVEESQKRKTPKGN
ncbi:MAG: electron transfer flavoprotein subunit alpha/FixB family protein [Deltaproteobacteria bacterium]|uniref:electron transfer flavoprotein subunit alpha/FixB family protein n=1 Tax=Desulfobacula sp. TaxID=2593537 RepID=UPI0019C5F381|nr:electron transfer flavoprotein subunit alpha/FixB family protein [Candidatus Desulfobacula maris]MBL6992936.1 electron transfer flavoprotein subunit alpha/FixB family protein [Desulfobacula sp.]